MYTMDALWAPCAYPIYSLLVPYGFLMDAPYTPRWIPMDILWSTNICPMDTHAYPRCSLWIPCGCQQYNLLTPTDFSCIPHIFPMDALIDTLWMIMNTLWIP